MMSGNLQRRFGEVPLFIFVISPKMEQKGSILIGSFKPTFLISLKLPSSWYSKNYRLTFKQWNNSTTNPKDVGRKLMRNRYITRQHGVIFHDCYLHLQGCTARWLCNKETNCVMKMKILVFCLEDGGLGPSETFVRHVPLCSNFSWSN